MHPIHWHNSTDDEEDEGMTMEDEEVDLWYISKRHRLVNPLYASTVNFIQHKSFELKFSILDCSSYSHRGKAEVKS